jgi:uncharacterized protein (TIGR03546 family)
MLLIVKFLAKIFTILNSEISPKQIAAGFAYGVIIGLVPVSGLMPVLLLLVGLIINFNLAALFLAAAVFKLLSFAIDPVANQVGFYALTKVPALVPFWTKLYNMPIIPYTKYNNTIVMGSLIVGILLFIPMYLLAKSFVVNYRQNYRQRVEKWKIVQVVKASTFYKYYLSYKEFTGS